MRSVGPAGPQTFYASGEETDSFRGDKVTFDVTNMDTGIPAIPGHYSTSDILGFDPPPGVAFQIQVAAHTAASARSAHDLAIASLTMRGARAYQCWPKDM